VDTVLEWILKIIRLFAPPADADPKTQLFWRWRIAGCACLSFWGTAWLLVESHATAKPPLIDPLVHRSTFDDFAKQQADDHRETIKEIHETRAASIETEIATLRPLYCKTSSQEAAGLYWERIIKLRDRYKELTEGRVYDLQPCPPGEDTQSIRRQP
jgi:hypothetical protein